MQNRREAELCAELFRRERWQASSSGPEFRRRAGGGLDRAPGRIGRAGDDLRLPGRRAVCPRARLRRDAFCGLLSIGEALRQIGRAIACAGGRSFPRDPSFAEDLDWFGAGLPRRQRRSQRPLRPDGHAAESFWTCRFDEKQLQRLGADDGGARPVGGHRRGDGDRGLRSGDAADHRRACRNMPTRRAWPTQRGPQREAGAVSPPLARGQRPGRPGRAMLDVDPAELRRVQLHGHEPAWRRGHSFRLRGRHPGGDVDARLHAGQRARPRLADWNNLHHADDELANVWHCGVFPGPLPSEGPHDAARDHGRPRRRRPPDHGEGVLELVAKPCPVTLCRVTQDAGGDWKALVVEGSLRTRRRRSAATAGAASPTCSGSTATCSCGISPTTWR